eukprot:CAMPEP_0119373392 /NCGR_PEP_ID=MMETSP1334-20130426/25618_1 /TAXON_ID=127549 /ORGANISM="Calcidiscus leptoporus, Strain RCC1130" /LENGTH=219 /DNA_ID=CAMNT_0007391163 /DNA_START=61 /DNA_END=720 /DNA_ORIENTATION=-
MPASEQSWRYQEPAGFARFEGLPSPPLVAADPSSPLLEYASFLEPLSNFSLDDEPSATASSPSAHSPSSAPRGTTEAPEQTGSSRVSPHMHFPFSRQHSHDLQLVVQSAFDEMDDVLAQKASRSKLSASAPIFTPEQTPPALPMELEPTEEEQSWLERQCDVMERCSAIEAEVEAEERFVQRMLSQHPTLPADEARRLYDVEYPSSPEPLAPTSWPAEP